MATILQNAIQYNGKIYISTLQKEWVEVLPHFHIDGANK